MFGSLQPTEVILIWFRAPGLGQFQATHVAIQEGSQKTKGFSLSPALFLNKQSVQNVFQYNSSIIAISLNILQIDMY